MTLKSFSTHDTLNLKKEQDTSIFGQVAVFFSWRPDLELTFQFRAVSDRTRDRTPTPSPTSAVARNCPITFLPPQFSQ